jgi:hypothetical protein
MKTIVWGTLVGGIVLFAWGAISWTALPWRNTVFQHFSNEEAITQALMAGAKEPGMYTVPGMLEGGTPEQQKAMQEKIAKGGRSCSQPYGPGLWARSLRFSSIRH